MDAKAALAALRKNLTELRITQGFTLEDRGVGALLQRLSKAQPVDVVFLDPPYEAENEYSGTLNFFGSERGRALLAADALVVAEHSSKTKLAERHGALVKSRFLKQGDAALSFFVVGRDSQAGSEERVD